jgi:hypothetical protein
MRQVIEHDLRKVSAKLEETETELMGALSRATSAEAQLAQAEERRRAMESRAIDAEGAFKKLERLIRTQLAELGKDFDRHSDLKSRAARAA